MLKAGQKAPDFSLKGTDGKSYSLKKFKGKRIILYFYPKDNTPGCTLEGCNFRDRNKEFERLNAAVLGVSADTIASHKKFSSRYNFNFPLLADVGGKVAKKYGVWKEKSFLGKRYMGIERSTFIIDGKGRIAAAFLKVNPIGHVQGMVHALGMMR